MKRYYDLPFLKAWRKPGLDFERYEKIAFAPVITESLQRYAREDEVEFATRQAAAEELADFTVETFKETFANDKDKTFQVVEGSDDGDALVCELAIAEYTPTNRLGTTAGYGLGVAGQALREVFLTLQGTVLRGAGVRGQITMEGRLSEAASGQVVFRFADRESGRASLFNVKDFQQSGHARDQIRLWAKQLLAVMKKEEGQKILDPLPFELNPF